VYIPVRVKPRAEALEPVLARDLESRYQAREGILLARYSDTVIVA